MHVHSPLCPAVIRGAGSRRNLCGSIYPRNHMFRCGLPLGHETWDHGFWMLAEGDAEGVAEPEFVSYGPRDECWNGEVPGYHRWWSHAAAQKSRPVRAGAYEVTEVWLV